MICRKLRALIFLILFWSWINIVMIINYVFHLIKTKVFSISFFTVNSSESTLKLFWNIFPGSYLPKENWKEWWSDLMWFSNHVVKSDMFKFGKWFARILNLNQSISYNRKLKSQERISRLVNDFFNFIWKSRFELAKR